MSGCILFHGSALGAASITFVPIELSYTLFAINTGPDAKTPGSPWLRNSAELRAAYRRAGLHHWAEDLNQSSGGSEAAEVAEWQLPAPKITVDCCVRGVVLTLPHDSDPGTAQRFTELWAKAFAQVRKALQKSDPSHLLCN